MNQHPLGRRQLIAGMLATPVAVGLGASAAQAAPVRADLGDVVPQTHAHDYELDRPLLDALSNGFVSVEADVWLVDGQLLVAHDEVDLDPKRTLESLHRSPARHRQGQGRSVYPGWNGSPQLLIRTKAPSSLTTARPRFSTTRPARPLSR